MIFPVKHIPDDPEGIDAIKDGVSGYLIEKENYQDLTTITVHFLHGELSIDALQSQIMQNCFYSINYWKNLITF